MRLFSTVFVAFDYTSNYSYKIATKYGKTLAQVVLRWDLQKGVTTIPRSGKPKEIIENAQLFDFKLTDHDFYCN